MAPDRVEMHEWEGHGVEVRFSARRRRTATARVEAGRLVVLAPGHLRGGEVADLLGRLLPRVLAHQANAADPEALARRAQRISRALLGGRAVPREVRWVAPMRTRWASCTPSTGVIRVSETLRHAPGWVLDSVLLHELAHLLERGHGPRFQEIVSVDPHLERANAYLLGYAHGARLAIGPLGAGEDEDAPG